MVDFAGWDMPLNYGSQIAEHRIVRSAAGMFDVSHMTIIDINGAGDRDFLRRLVANDVAKLTGVGQALYGVLLNADAGIIDDLIVYRRESGYRCVVNAATRDKVLHWFSEHNEEGITLAERDLAMIAVQGPAALERFEEVSVERNVASIAAFTAHEHGDWMIARTGYTGEDGLEIMLPPADAIQLWADLAAAGVQPAGLAARDTLRLEAGLNLYGQDMDESTNPLISNLGWTIGWIDETRSFIGRDALTKIRAAGVGERLAGLVMMQKGVLRHGQRVITEVGEGTITSGSFSPTLGYSIALARVPRTAKGTCQVDVRGKLKGVRIVRPPFVRHGRSVL
jgi:aminomethyltransferase